MLKNILNRTANATGYYGVKAKEGLIGNGKDKRGMLNEMRTAYRAGTQGLTYAKKEKEQVTVESMDDEVQAFILKHRLVRK